MLTVKSIRHPNMSHSREEMQMNQNDQSTVEALHKVTLTIAPEPPDADNATPTTVTLIAGVGVDGLTPIEQELIGRSVGDTLSVDLTSGCWEAVMGPIPSLPKTAWAHEAPQRITVTIMATQPADPREVIKEMAFSSGGCGCSDGCDCGCGGH